MAGRPRTNPDRATTGAERMAAFKTRLAALTPLEHCAREAGYMTVDTDRWVVKLPGLKSRAS